MPRYPRERTPFVQLLLTVQLFLSTSICLRICMIDWKTGWVGITKYEICVSARLARSITDSLSASVNRLYFHSGRIVRWKNKLRTVVCSCDLDLEILCEGNQRLSRCTTKVGSTGQPCLVTPAATRSGGDQNRPKCLAVRSQ